LADISGEGVVVAVIDTGIDYNHEDISPTSGLIAAKFQITV